MIASIRWRTAVKASRASGLGDWDRCSQTDARDAVTRPQLQELQDPGHVTVRDPGRSLRTGTGTSCLAPSLGRRPAAPRLSLSTVSPAEPLAAHDQPTGASRLVVVPRTSSLCRGSVGPGFGTPGERTPAIPTTVFPAAGCANHSECGLSSVTNSRDERTTARPSRTMWTNLASGKISRMNGRRRQLLGVFSANRERPDLARKSVKVRSMCRRMDGVTSARPENVVPAVVVVPGPNVARLLPVCDVRVRGYGAPQHRGSRAVRADQDDWRLQTWHGWHPA